MNLMLPYHRNPYLRDSSAFSLFDKLPLPNELCALGDSLRISRFPNDFDWSKLMDGYRQNLLKSSHQIDEKGFFPSDVAIELTITDMNVISDSQTKGRIRYFLQYGLTSLFWEIKNKKCFTNIPELAFVIVYTNGRLRREILSELQKRVTWEIAMNLNSTSVERRLGEELIQWVSKHENKAKEVGLTTNEQGEVVIQRENLLIM